MFLSPTSVIFGNFVVIDLKNNIKLDLTCRMFLVPLYQFPSHFLLGDLVNANPAYTYLKLQASPKWVNSLGPSDTICRHKSGSTLAQVMACCQMAPSHYLNNVDLSSVRSSGIRLRAILQEISQPSVTEFSLKITYLKFCSNLPGANELREVHLALNMV